MIDISFSNIFFINIIWIIFIPDSRVLDQDFLALFVGFFIILRCEISLSNIGNWFFLDLLSLDQFLKISILFVSLLPCCKVFILFQFIFIFCRNSWVLVIVRIFSLIFNDIFNRSCKECSKLLQIFTTIIITFR